MIICRSVRNSSPGPADERRHRATAPVKEGGKSFLVIKETMRLDSIISKRVNTQVLKDGLHLLMLLSQTSDRPIRRHGTPIPMCEIIHAIEPIQTGGVHLLPD